MGFVAPDKWQPNWIGSEERTPLLRKEFKVAQPVKRAWVYASALGLYELRLNGSKVGSDLFAPGWTDYRQRVQYQRYDVTDQVKNGDNVIGAEIAPGWFAGKIAWFSNNRYGKQVSFAAELHLEFADGSTQIVATDGTWKTSAGPLTASDIQDGDQYDARLEKNGWDKPGYNDSNWTAAEVRTGENRNLVAQQDQPVGVVREMKPVKVTEPTPGVFVYDLGQNITGVARIAVKGAKGTTITLRLAERLNADGTLDVTNLKESKATDTYIMSGNGVETFQPKFTFPWLPLDFHRRIGKGTCARRCDRGRHRLALSRNRFAPNLESGSESPPVEHSLDDSQLLFVRAAWIRRSAPSASAGRATRT